MAPIRESSVQPETCTLPSRASIPMATFVRTFRQRLLHEFVILHGGRSEHHALNAGVEKTFTTVMLRIPPPT